MDQEVSGIKQRISRLDEDLATHGMSDECRGKVMVAQGKGNLLINKKIKQFIGLCHKNIVSTSRIQQGESWGNFVGAAKWKWRRILNITNTMRCNAGWDKLDNCRGHSQTQSHKRIYIVFFEIVYTFGPSLYYTYNKMYKLYI